MNTEIADQLWLQAFQKKQSDKFAQRGFPTRKEEGWKYSNIDFIRKQFDLASNEPSKGLYLLPKYISSMQSCANQLVFVNGIFSAELSSIHDLPANVLLSPLSQAKATHEQLVKTAILKDYSEQKYPFAALNNAKMKEGVFLYVPKNICLTSPIHIVFYSSSEAPLRVHPRNIYILDEGAEATIIEEYISDTDNNITNVLTDINVKTNARLNFHKIQDENLSSAHLANIFIHQEQDSRVELFSLAKGARFSRDDVSVSLVERGAECHLAGLYMPHHDEQYIDNHLHIDHAAEHGTSSMLYKGILNKKSCAVFNGKVYVHPNAQNINALQSNHNLLLSKDAEVNTKPELEIYADNVKCSHGATVGQLDAEALFYFRSRGINKDGAMKLLLNAFADEVLSKIKHSDIRLYIQERVGSYVAI